MSACVCLCLCGSRTRREIDVEERIESRRFRDSTDDIIECAGRTKFRDILIQSQASLQICCEAYFTIKSYWLIYNPRLQRLTGAMTLHSDQMEPSSGAGCVGILVGAISRESRPFICPSTASHPPLHSALKRQFLRSQLCYSSVPPVHARAMASISQQQPSEPPPSAANIATAYPRRTTHNSIPKLLTALTFLATLAALIVHRANYPITRPIRSFFARSFLASTTTTKPSSSQPPVPAQALSPGGLAVCYSGHVGTHASVAQQNRDVVNEIDPDASFFYHIDLKDAYHHERTGVRYENTHEIGTMQPIFDKSKAVVRTFSSEDILPPTQSRCHKRDGKDWEHYSYNYVTFFAANGCYELLKRKEEENGKQFEWILSLRPDMKIVVKMPPENTEKRVHLSGAAMALIPREMAPAYFSISDAFDDEKCEQFDAMGDEPCKDYAYESEATECLIIKWLKKKGIVPSNGVYVNRRIIYPAADDS